MLYPITFLGLFDRWQYVRFPLKQWHQDGCRFPPWLTAQAGGQIESAATKPGQGFAAFLEVTRYSKSLWLG
jgi:hypothetical protein